MSGPHRWFLVLTSYFLLTLLSARQLDAQTDAGSYVFGGKRGAAWVDSDGLNILADFESAPGALQPLELRPDVNIAPIIFSRHPYTYYVEPRDPLWQDGMPRIFRGFGHHHGPGEVRPFSNRVDGDLGTYVAFRGYRKMFQEFYTLDFGGALFLERFAVQMPADSLVDITGEPLVNYVATRGELSASLTGPTLLRDLRENMHLSYLPLEAILGGVEQNLEAPIVIDFAPTYYRYVRWRIFEEWITAQNYHSVEKYGYAEFEVFGRGIPATARFRTKPVDLGQPALLGPIDVGLTRWRREDSGWVDSVDAAGDVIGRTWDPGHLVETPNAEAAVSVRFKTGTTPDPLIYFTWNDFAGLDAIDREAWLALKARDENDPEFVGFRGPVINDRDDWTPWSGPAVHAGTRVALAGGRYLQADVHFESGRPTDFVRLDSVAIELIPLLAPLIVAEAGVPGAGSDASIARLPLGEPTELTVAIRALFDGESADGFEAVHLSTPSPPEFVGLLMGTPLKAVTLPPEDIVTGSDGLTLFLPRPVAADEQLQIQLRTTLFSLSDRLVGEVFNRSDATVRQRVDEGDATDLIATDQLVVIASDNISATIADVRATPSRFTPNGDGHNDKSRISYSLFGVNDGIVDIRIFSLSGEVVRHIVRDGQQAGIVRSLSWDGRDRVGARVPPGLYLCQVATDTSRGRSATTIPIAVVY